MSNNRAVDCGAKYGHTFGALLKENERLTQELEIQQCMYSQLQRNHNTLQNECKRLRNELIAMAQGQSSHTDLMHKLQQTTELYQRMNDLYHKTEKEKQALINALRAKDSSIVKMAEQIYGG